MQSITCQTCGHEFDSPALDQNGPCCPRCGDQLSPALVSRLPATGADVYLGALVTGAALGLLVASILLLMRW
jgi:hypothetical protein